MPIADLVWIGAVSVVWLLVGGIGPAALLFPRVRRSELLLLAFPIGISVWLLALHLLSAIGFGLRLAWILVFVGSLPCLVLALLRFRFRPKGGISAGLLMASLLVLVGAVWPMGDRDKAHPIGTNGDIVLYSATASHLWDQGLFELGEYDSPIERALLGVGWGEPIGFSLLLGTVSGLTDLPAERIISVSTALILALVPFGLARLARRTLGWGIRPWIALAFFGSLHPLWFWLHTEGSGRQLLSLPLLLFVWSELPFAISIGGWRRCSIVAIPFAALWIVYPYAVPFALLPAILMILQSCWGVGSSRKRGARTALRTGLVLTGLTILLAPVGIFQAGRGLAILPSLPRPIFGESTLLRKSDPYVPLTLTTGSVHPYSGSVSPSSIGLAWFGLGIVGLFGGIALIRAGGGRRERACLLGWGIACLLSLLVTRLLIGHHSAYFKSMVYAAIPIGVLVVLPIARRIRGGWIPLVVCLSIACFTHFQIGQEVYRTKRYDQEVFEDVAQFIRSSAGDRSVRITDYDDRRVFWWSYHLEGIQQRLTIPMTSYVIDYSVPGRDPEEMVLPFYDAPFDERFAIVREGVPVPIWCGERVYRRADYSLFSRRPEVVTCLEPGLVRSRRFLGSGWSDPIESSWGALREITGKAGGFTLILFPQEGEIELGRVGLVWTGSYPLELLIEFEGEEIFTTTVPSSEQLQEFTFPILAGSCPAGECNGKFRIRNPDSATGLGVAYLLLER